MTDRERALMSVFVQEYNDMKKKEAQQIKRANHRKPKRR